MRFSRYAGSTLVLVPIAAVLSLSGCAYQYVDAVGTRHIWGITHTKIRSNTTMSSEARAQQTTTFGLAILNLPEESGAALGYHRNFSLEVYGDSVGEITVPFARPMEFEHRHAKESVYELLDRDE